MSPLSIVIAALWLPSALALGEQTPPPNAPTLLEMARQHPGTIKQRFLCGYVGKPPTFESIVREAQVIVHGTVVSADGRLSADAQEVWTDYSVQPVEITREGSPPLSTPIVFTALGGTVIVEGLTITLDVDDHGRKIALKAGDDVVLLGNKRGDQLVLNSIGVFNVQDGVVKPNGALPGFSVDQQAVPLETFVARVRDINP